MWDTVSPLLMDATEVGIQQGSLLPFFNRGTITLLQKDGDSTLLTNKRPITLLNAVYKIWAKALQIRLSPVLQRIVTWEQNAFLPGRNLHSTVFLCNEAVFEAKRLQQDAVLLKIYFRKTFDTLRWQFLYEVMEKMLFGQQFISFVQALNTNAASSVRTTTAVPGTFRFHVQSCSVHLSPLLFTIAIQALTDGVNLKLQMNQLAGIQINCIGIQYCQGYFADDSHLLLAANQANLLNAKNLLHQFGEASGLMVQWGKSKARWISPNNQRPTWTADLDWVWGTHEEAEKFLAFYFTDTLQEDRIFQAAKQKIIDRINSPTARSTTIHGHVVIANHIIYGIIWFLLPLWSGDKRGLGLLSLHAQTQAFVAKTIRWAYMPGSHPLKNWLIQKFQSTAELRWNSTHLTWVTSPSKGGFPPLSPLMLRICKAWQTTAKLLSPLRHLPLLSWKQVSIWGPKNPGTRQITRSAAKGHNARLKGAGLEILWDITDNGSIFPTIEDMIDTSTPIANSTRSAFDRLLATTPRHSAGYRCSSNFAAEEAAMPPCCICLTDEAPMEDAALNASHARLAFHVLEGVLIPANMRDIPMNSNWARVPVTTVWASQKKAPTRHLGSWEDQNALIAALQWRDQSEFLAVPNANIRRIATTDTSTIHKRLSKWERSHHIDPENVTRWAKLWRKKKPVKYAMLQWNIFFHAVPTNSWRHPQLSRQQQETWCVCCDTRSAEDIHHLFWTFLAVLEIWEWAIDVTNIAFPETRRWSPRFTLWSQRNDLIFRNARTSLGKAKALAWHKMIIQTRKDWRRHCQDSDALELTLLRRQELDRKVARKLQ
ncbi:hypothetical protein R1sor_008922 [Riccia sorocarpa]|uniref:Reverse transcriptase domain-containing protein n=1 Tax=Riccia sorocarpa TaxID=122646 RepID=A0ABD3H4Y3_9MARC